MHMVSDDRTDALFRVIGRLCRNYDLFFQRVHSEAHYVEEKISLAGNVMVEPGFCYPDSLGDIVHRSRVVAFFADNLGCGAIDFG
jgi:hypothetical protein